MPLGECGAPDVTGYDETKDIAFFDRPADDVARRADRHVRRLLSGRRARAPRGARPPEESDLKIAV